VTKEGESKMAYEKKYYMPMYVKEYLSDLNVQMMTWEQRGFYDHLIFHCWLHGSVPAAIDDLAQMAHMSVEEFQSRIWHRVSRCFVEQDGHLIHPKVEKVRKEKTQVSENRSKARKNKPCEILSEVCQNFDNDLSEVCERFDDDLSLQNSPYQKKKYIPPIVPQENSRDGEVPPVDSSRLFRRFWEAYPNKIQEETTLQTWLSLPMTEKLFGEIMAGLERYKGSELWNKDGGKYIAAPTTFLRGNAKSMGKMWKDFPPQVDNNYPYKYYEAPEPPVN
jgi:uncharacterized protein YdaU (DUF1376 family)